jgi:hypothetical protein
MKKIYTLNPRCYDLLVTDYGIRMALHLPISLPDLALQNPTNFPDVVEKVD